MAKVFCQTDFDRHRTDLCGHYHCVFRPADDAGDPVLMMLSRDGSAVNQEAYDALEAELGLDQPVMTQYVNWITDLLHGDLGQSYSENRPVVEAIQDRLPRTLELAAAALVLACIIGIPLGIISAVRRGGFVDLGLTLISSLGNSVPVFVMGYLLVLIFALTFQVLPSSGYVPVARGLENHLLRLILPAVALAFGVAGLHPADDPLQHAGVFGQRVGAPPAGQGSVQAEGVSEACDAQYAHPRRHHYRSAAGQPDRRHRAVRGGIQLARHCHPAGERHRRPGLSADSGLYADPVRNFHFDQYGGGYAVWDAGSTGALGG